MWWNSSMTWIGFLPKRAGVSTVLIASSICWREFAIFAWLERRSIICPSDQGGEWFASQSCQYAISSQSLPKAQLNWVSKNQIMITAKNKVGICISGGHISFGYPWKIVCSCSLWYWIFQSYNEKSGIKIHIPKCFCILHTHTETSQI